MTALVNWRDSVVLRNGEHIVQCCHSWRPVYAKVEPVSAHIFVLTNQRLVVLREEADLDKRYIKDYITKGRPEITSVELKKAFPLESIKDLSWEGPRGFGTPISIYTDEGKFDFETKQFHCEGCHGRQESIREDFDYFREKVVQQIGALRKMSLDFSSLKSLMEKGGIVLAELKCPHCNAPIKMPKDGNQTICEHCRSVIYAHDIFEKIKALIS